MSAAGGESLPQSVLFVCTANLIRSPMAAGLMALRFGALVRAESVGVRAEGGAPDPIAIAVMDELGFDLAGHRPRSLADLEEDARYDLAISLSPEAHHRVLDLVPTLADAAEYWPTFDPALAEGSREQVLMEYRAVRDGLDARIAKRFLRPSTG